MDIVGMDTNGFPGAQQPPKSKLTRSFQLWKRKTNIGSTGSFDQTLASTTSLPDIPDNFDDSHVDDIEKNNLRNNTSSPDTIVTDPSSTISS